MGERAGEPRSFIIYAIDQWTHDHWIADGGKTLNDRLTACARELRVLPLAFTLEPSIVAELDAIVRGAAGA